MSLDPAGANLIVTDSGNYIIRQIVLGPLPVPPPYPPPSPPAPPPPYGASPTPIMVTTLVGGSSAASCTHVDGPALGAGLVPVGLTMDYAGCGGAGCLYWAEVFQAGANAIRKLDMSTGQTTTLTGFTSCPAGTNNGYVDGPATSACFSNPSSIVFVPSTGEWL